MKSNTANKKVNDKTMVIVAVVTVVVLFLLWRVVAKPIINKTRYDGYLNDLTISLNNANEEIKPVMAIMDGKEYKLDAYSKATYYSYLVDLGMGMPIGGEPGEEVFSIRFPDGTNLDFREGDITQGPRKGRKGTYIYYTGPTGKTYNYASDNATLRYIKDILEQQIFWEEYEEKLRKEALEERAKEIEAKLEAEKDAEGDGTEEPGQQSPDESVEESAEAEGGQGAEETGQPDPDEDSTEGN